MHPATPRDRRAAVRCAAARAPALSDACVLTCLGVFACPISGPHYDVGGCALVRRERGRPRRALIHLSVKSGLAHAVSATRGGRAIGLACLSRVQRFEFEGAPDARARARARAIPRLPCATPTDTVAISTMASEKRSTPEDVVSSTRSTRSQRCRMPPAVCPDARTLTRTCTQTAARLTHRSLRVLTQCSRRSSRRRRARL